MRGSTMRIRLERNAEWLAKGVDGHAMMEVPKGSKHTHFGHLPEVEDHPFRRGKKGDSP